MHKQFKDNIPKGQYKRFIQIGCFWFCIFLSYSLYATDFSNRQEGDFYSEKTSTTTDAKQRIQAWKGLINGRKPTHISSLLRKVNDFFNHLTYIPENTFDDTTDEWLTPYEFLAANGGDCEEFAIAKYFTLLAMGVPEKKLRITYVTIQRENQAHMILAYYETPAADPLILDSLTKKILPASKRQDLLPVYSFNTEDVWLHNNREMAIPYGKASSLSKWQALLKRFKQQGGI